MNTQKSNKQTARRGRDSSYETYDPSKVSKVIIRNDYQTLDSVKIRLDDGDKDKTISLDRGEDLVLTVKGDISEPQLEYSSSVVQQVDLNDGDSSDDIGTPNVDGWNENNTLTYDSGDNNKYEIINFGTCEYLKKASDQDGIDGGPSAKLETDVDEANEAIVITLTA